MKKCYFMLSFVILALLSNGCENWRQGVRKKAKEQEIALTQGTVDKVVGRIQYIKDPRTGLCFAYYWGGTANGGPALATVPSEALPPELLTIANVLSLPTKKD